jgi:farnesyl-diphosphate farnesyltransferase
MNTPPDALPQKALEALETTSRTFFVPISRLPAGLMEAVGSAYLCMRAIDEIEDHPTLDASTKQGLLRRISQALQSAPACDGRDNGWTDWQSPVPETELPEVTRYLLDWIKLAPHNIAPRIQDATAAMADRMAGWVASNWSVHTEADLDQYTFSVAGSVGLLLSDLWAWYDGTQTDRQDAIGFGRGLQAVNILRNRAEDLLRGVDFFPDGWDEARMQAYARRNLQAADAYVASLPPGPAMEFCKLPLALAYATLDALAQGRKKLERGEVLRILAESA